MMIERTRIIDTIYLKYGIRTVDLMEAVSEYKMMDDP